MLVLFPIFQLHISSVDTSDHLKRVLKSSPEGALLRAIGTWNQFQGRGPVMV